MPEDPSPAYFDRLRQIFESFPHSAELGMKVLEMTPGRATIRLDYQDRLIGNAEKGFVHGGAVTTLLDSVCGLATFSTVAEGLTIATLDLRIDYMRPATPGEDIIGFAECYKATRNVAFARGIAHHGSADDLIANCAATFMLGSAGYTASPAKGRRRKAKAS